MESRQLLHAGVLSFTPNLVRVGDIALTYVGISSHSGAHLTNYWGAAANANGIFQGVVGRLGVTANSVPDRRILILSADSAQAPPREAPAVQSGAFAMPVSPVAAAPQVEASFSESSVHSVVQSVAQSVVSNIEVTTRIDAPRGETTLATATTARASTSGLYAAITNTACGLQGLSPLPRAAAAVQAATAQPIINAAVKAGQVVEAATAALGSAAESIASGRRVFDIVQLGSPLTLVADSIGAFIEESAMIGSADAPMLRQPHRAWLVTATVLAADLVLMTWYYQKRKTRFAHVPVRI